MGQYINAKEDGEKCIEVKPDWGKGFQRRAMALHAMGEFDEALKDYQTGCKFDPENAQLKQGLEQCKREQDASVGAGGDESGMFGPESMMKLMANPRIA